MPNRKEILDYLFNSENVISFYRDAMNVGFWPDFPDREVEELIWYMDKAGISNFNEIDSLLSNNVSLLRVYISSIHSKRVTTWRVTPGFLCALALILKYVDSFSVANLTEIGWDERNALNVIENAKTMKNIFQKNNQT